MGRKGKAGSGARLALAAIALAAIPSAAPAAGICPIRFDYRSDHGTVVSAGTITCQEELAPPANAEDAYLLRVEQGATLVAAMQRIPLPGAAGSFELRMLTPAGVDVTGQMCQTSGTGGTICRRSGAEGGEWTAIVRSLGGAAGPYVLTADHLFPSAGPPPGVGQTCEPAGDASNSSAAPSSPPPTTLGAPFVCSGALGTAGDIADWYGMTVTTSVAAVEVAAVPAAGFDLKIVIIRPNGGMQTFNDGQAGEPEAAAIPSVGQQGLWRIGILPDEAPAAFPASYTLEAGAYVP